MRGRVFSLPLGQARVFGNDGAFYTCHLRSKVKSGENKVLVGDEVEFDPAQTVVLSIYPRKNELVRPRVSNIDQIVICLTVEPAADLAMVDKLIIAAQQKKITPIICVTKRDKTGENFVDEICAQYQPIGVRVVSVSGVTGENIDEIRGLFKNKITVLAGQSGVGKSTLINALDDSLNLKTGELTKIARGKNTTTGSEIFSLSGGLVLDTAGFSVFDLNGLSAQEFLMAYPDVYKFAGECDYKSCNHLNKTTDECGVLRALEGGKINRARFARFLATYQRLAGLKPKYEKQNKSKRGNKNV